MQKVYWSHVIVKFLFLRWALKYPAENQVFFLPEQPLLAIPLVLQSPYNH